MTPSQLESLIQREAEKYGRPYPSWRDSAEIKRIEQGKVDAFTAGASLLAQPLLEALGALEKYKTAGFQIEGKYYSVGSKADQALQRIKELLGGGK